MDKDILAKAVPAKSKVAQCEDSLKEIRHGMCDMIRPPTKVMTLAGYFPHVFTEDYRLSATFFTSPLIWSLFILVSTIGKVLAFSLLRSTLFPHLQSSSSTEQFCNQLLFFTLYSTSCFFKVQAVIKRKQTASFWNRTCSLLQQFCNGDKDFNLFSSEGKYHYLYIFNCARVKAGAWIIVGYSILVPILQTFEHPGKLSGHQDFDQGTSNNDTAIALPENVTYIIIFLLRFTSSFTQLHASFVAFIIVFIKTYAACLQIILSEMKETISQLQASSLPITSVNSAAEPSYGNKHAQKVKNCIESYDVLEDLVELFNEHFAAEIICHILFSVVSILVHAFYMVFRQLQGTIVSKMTTLVPPLTLGIQLYVIATDATRFRTLAKAIMVELSKIDPEKVPRPLQFKVSRRPTVKIH